MINKIHARATSLSKLPVTFAVLPVTLLKLRTVEFWLQPVNNFTLEPKKSEKSTGQITLKRLSRALLCPW